MITINAKITIPASEVELKYSRSSGPGGQHVNKTNSKVTLVWDLQNSQAIDQAVKNRFLKLHGNKVNQEGQVIVQADGSRDQKRNVESCFEKIRIMVVESLKRPKKRVGTKPTKGSIERRLRHKKQQAEKKQSRQKLKDY